MTFTPPCLSAIIDHNVEAGPSMQVRICRRDEMTKNSTATEISRGTVEAGFDDILQIPSLVQQLDEAKRRAAKYAALEKVSTRQLQAQKRMEELVIAYHSELI